MATYEKSLFLVDVCFFGDDDGGDDGDDGDYGDDDGCFGDELKGADMKQ